MTELCAQDSKEKKASENPNKHRRLILFSSLIFKYLPDATN